MPPSVCPVKTFWDGHSSSASLLWVFTVDRPSYWSHPLYFIFLNGYLKVSSYKDKSQLACVQLTGGKCVLTHQVQGSSCGPGWRFPCTFCYLYQAAPRLPLKVSRLEQTAWIWPWVIGVTSSFRAFVRLFKSPKGIYVHIWESFTSPANSAIWDVAGGKKEMQNTSEDKIAFSQVMH